MAVTLFSNIFVVSAAKLHVYSQAGQLYLNYQEPGQFYRALKMEKESNNWWYADELPDLIRFNIVDDKGQTDNLGGVLGEYPGDPAEDYSLNSQESWLKDGLLYPYNPDKIKPSDILTILTLNMHTYQEKNQSEKLATIALAINKLNPDIVCFQECAQDRSSPLLKKHYGKDIRTDNMAEIITTLLREKYAKNYDYYWDWSHYGWDRWEEGVAVLAKYPLAKCDSHYVSHNTEKTFWKSRNVVYAEVATPLGTINVFSAHLGWWTDTEEPYRFQIDNLLSWESSLQNKKITATFMCGDFNEAAGSEGYNYTIKNGKIIDSYFACFANSMLDSTIGGKIDGWQDGDGLGKRIDYIFMNDGAKLKPILAQRIFTEKCFGRVSDHVGVYAFFKK
jgi:maltose 6'-phosphate phosphatase